MNDYPKGAEWRKWDLHVHTPASINFNGSYEQLITQINNCDCDVIGINDYFTVAGYKYLMSKGSELDKILLPVVEFRGHNIIGDRRNPKSATRMNFHVLFNPAIGIDRIEGFIKSLRFKDGTGNYKLIESVYTDLDELSKIDVDYFDVIEMLNSATDFINNYLVLVEYEGYGGIDGIDPQSSFFKAAIISKADIIVTSRQKQIDFFHWMDDKFEIEDYEDWFNAPKACIKGSDSHDHTYPIGQLKDESSSPIEKYCWIKADPTFYGLMQIKNEPKERVYIGKCPPIFNRINTNKTKYVTSLEIKKLDNSGFQEIWFNSTTPINPGLIAIIGNKGSGKSAFSDILGLLGNSKLESNFSFLNKNKFRDRKCNKSKYFEASLTWISGESESKTLDSHVDCSSYETIKYIPQNYLEEICNEITESSSGKFNDELQEVIFSHIDDSDKLGTDSLRSLIDKRTSEAHESIQLIKVDIKELNHQIIEYESILSDTYIEKLKNKLQEKNKELLSLNDSKPQEVIQPSDESPSKDSQELNINIEKAEKLIEGLNEEISKSKKKKFELKNNHAKACSIIDRFRNFERGIDKLKEDVSDELNDLDISLSDIFTYEINLSKLENLVSIYDKELEAIEDQLDENNVDSKLSQLNKYKKELSELEAQLDIPKQKYQTYIKKLSAWEDARQEIIGDKIKIGTIKFLESKITEIENVPEIVSNLRQKRKEKVKEIHSILLSLVIMYQELYKPVEEYLTKHAGDDDNIKLGFNAIIEPSNFKDIFFEFIRHDRSGKFLGIEEGNKQLLNLMELTDYNNADEVIDFLNGILMELSDNKEKLGVNIDQSIRKNRSVQEFYDFLFSLEYLKPRYNLTWDDKTLDQLSPGEKGTLLLVFYLLIDKNDIPLVIDQPEENLDNETVFRILVKCIKHAKKRRQIIIVTHNPNLAVVCDAEQIIYSEIDKKNNFNVTYLSGSIENPKINKKLVDVLEGTRPAFDNRDLKYRSVHNNESVK